MRYNKLNYQLFLGISLAVILVAALGGLSFYSSHQGRVAEGWFNHTLLVKAKLQDINVGIKDNTANIRTLRKYDNADTLFRNANAVTINQEVADLQKLVEDNPEQKRNAEHLKARIGGLFTLWNSIDTRVTREDAAREKNYFNEEIRHIEGINALLQQMNAEEETLLQTRKKHAGSFAEMNKWFNIGGTCLVLILVIALSLIIAAELKKRKRAEGSLQKNLDKLATMNEKTRMHNEVLNGVQQLVEACQSASDVPAFARSVLESIARFLNVPAGVVYLIKEENENQLIPVSYTGIPEQQARAINIQQLPVSRDMAQQNVAIVKDVPAGFWKSQTAMGSAAPGSIAYLFLANHDRLMGVIEVGSFIPFTERATDYLHNIANVVSVRLATALVQESRNELMNELQEKQEILINQQEELRLANDELTHQTHILQASEEELRVQEEELKQINVELEEKNEALESAKEVLAYKASELEVSGKYKSEFLANMSHELRTPLNSVLILAGLLSDNKDNNLTDRQVEYARIIHNSGSDLLKLINDILDLSKIEAGKIDLVIESFKPDELLEHMRQMFAVVAEEKGIVFKTQAESDLPALITSDRQRLEQIVKNLLSNAIKFTPKNKSVTLHIKNGDLTQDGLPAPGILIEVKDTGIGIGKEKQQLIFEAFKQADGSTNRKFGGTGLGLSISKELARILGGSIAVQSEENKGSTFTIAIPLQYLDHKPQATAASEERKELQTPAPQPLRPAADGNKRTILIIEDDGNFASILKDFAEERNYKTLLAPDGKAGIEMATAYVPDAIILDLQMPVMDGWEVLRLLKDNEQLKNIPVHIISAIDEIRAPKEGAVAYLKKPVSKESLEHTFYLIGSQLHDRNRHLLILPGQNIKDDFLNRFVESIPEGIDYRFAEDIEACRKLALEQDFDCVIADIGTDIDEGIRQIELLKSMPAFRKISVILMIDREISATDEIKLKRVSEAVVMKSKEAQRRLTDELELFLHRINDRPETVRFNNTIHPLERNELKGRKVLIADDDMRNVFALVSMLEDQEMEVETASNGREAVEYIESGNPVDLVLMDIMMPEMDGYEAMGYIRNRLQLKSLPIIAITAKAMAEDRELCLAAGASDYISKPVDTQKLRSLLRVWLSQ